MDEHPTMGAMMLHTMFFYDKKKIQLLLEILH